MIPTIKYTATHLRCLLVLLLLMGGSNLFGQQQYNLVLNGSFEQYTICPSTTNYTVNPMFWYQCTNQLGVYENECSPTLCGGVPYNCIKSKNYQPARTGNAYIYLDYVNGYTFQYLQSQLQDSLITGHRYYVEFFVNLPNTMRFACNNHSLLFTNNTVYVDTINSPYGLLTANPQIMGYGNPIVTDTFGWQKISGIYKAIGGEKFITIGNFKDDTLTKLLDVNPAGYYGSGYIIDDVSVIPLDSFNLKADAGRDTTIHIGDSAFIGSLTNGIDSIKWQVLNTNGTIDSIRPGFWVHPTVNTCYVLTQTVNGFTSSDTVCVSVQTVPLKFISFQVQLEPTPNPSKEGNVKLDWQTANEINVSHFYIQSSTPELSGGKDFVIVGKVNANGASYNEYTFYDSPPVEGLGVVYYRIVSVDKDGKTSFSEVRQITISKEQLAISIYPNPAKDVVNIESAGAKEVMIIDGLGRVVYKEIASGTNLRNDATIINTQDFNKGLYVVKIVMKSGEVKSEKLIIK